MLDSNNALFRGFQCTMCISILNYVGSTQDYVHHIQNVEIDV